MSDTPQNPLLPADTAPPETKSIRPETPTMFGKDGLVIANSDDLKRVAELIQRSRLCPSFKEGGEGNEKATTTKASVSDVMLIIQKGAELGFTAANAIGAIKIIKGNFTLSVRAMQAIVLKHKDFKYSVFTESSTGYVDDASYVASVRLARADGEPQTFSFGLPDALMAGLWFQPVDGKKGWSTWDKYPKDLCMARAKSRAFQSLFGDVLMGLMSEEEANDIVGDPVDLHQVAEDAKGLYGAKGNGNGH